MFKFWNGHRKASFLWEKKGTLHLPSRKGTSITIHQRWLEMDRASQAGPKHDTIGSVWAQHSPHCSKVGPTRPELLCCAWVHTLARRHSGANSRARWGHGTARHGGDRAWGAVGYSSGRARWGRGAARAGRGASPHSAAVGAVGSKGRREAGRASTALCQHAYGRWTRVGTTQHCAARLARLTFGFLKNSTVFWMLGGV